MPNLRDMPPLLVPAPQQCNWEEGPVMLPGGAPAIIDQMLAHPGDPQSGRPYGIHVDWLPDRVLKSPLKQSGYTIRFGNTVAGEEETFGRIIPIQIRCTPGSLRYALLTLQQLTRQYGTRLPSMFIADSPAFATRGVMLDISRNKVPTLEQLKSVIDLISGLKFNHLQLYTEHTFAYRGHEEVWADASPLTPDDIRELDQYARDRAVDLAANQNCFGHLAAWLKHPKYNHLAEIEGDGLWKFMQWDRRGPFSLCPILPESEAFVRDLLGQLLPCFTSPLVNIGCDETFDVGFGRSADAVASASSRCSESEARADLFFTFVNKVCSIAREHGKRPMMWADIALRHPELLARLDKQTIGLAWGYEADAPFSKACDHLRAHGLEAWVCPGTSTWRSLTGRTAESRANLRAAAACGADEDRPGPATGFLVCDWGDVGHMQQWPLTMHRLAEAANAAWHGETEWNVMKFDTRATSLHVFNDRSLQIGRWISDLGDLDFDLRGRNRVRNATAIFNDLFPPVPPKPGHRYLTDAPLTEWVRLESRLAELESSRPLLADAESSLTLINRELAHTLAMTRLAVEHGASCRRSADGLNPHPDDRARLRVLAEHCLSELRRLWTIRNRPGGLDAASVHLQRVIDSLT